MSPGEWERRIRAAEARLVKVRPVRIVVINDPEDEASLAPYRLPPEVLARNETIEIGSLAQPDVDARNG
jgi:hypothetical protein